MYLSYLSFGTLFEFPVEPLGILRIHRNLFVWKQTDATATMILDKVNRFLQEWCNAHVIFTWVYLASTKRRGCRVTWEKLTGG
ncbi:hypothetical protein PVK06_001073 [Gossypium arboreum]|uniref:Uncharacterized protein n=1 Tax=Gossypium arboreum TaxID=29729 RepID=A0ABR0R1C0_GOSAR|nr:hypothetical protein PVK06_001073 [Gossypium arboreum]